MRTDVDALVANGGCTDIVRESALKADSGQKNPLPNRGPEPASILRLAFQSDAVPTELSPPLTAVAGTRMQTCVGSWTLSKEMANAIERCTH